MTPAEQIGQFFAALIPTRTVTHYNRRHDPPALARAMDVDAVHGILASAEAGDCQQLFALYRDILLADSHLQGRFVERKEALLGDTLSIQPVDKLHADDAAAAEIVKAQIVGHPDWEAALVHLLDSMLWPVAVVEKVYKPSMAPGLRYELASLVPVPHELLDFSTGSLRIRDTNPDTGSVIATAHEPDSRRYIVHRAHLLTTADNWGGPMRSLVFWWLLGTMGREWWTRFLDKYGAPFIVGKYDQADDQTRSILERAFSYAVRIGGLVVSRDAEIELKEAASQSTGEAFARFVELCNREKSKLILGETLSSDAQPTGLGSGVAAAQASKRGDKNRADARRLGATVQQQLAAQVLHINGARGRAPRFVWGSVSIEEATATGELLGKLGAAGLRPADSAIEVLSERVGFTIERAPAPAAPAPGALPMPFAAPSPAIDHEARIVGGAAAALAREFRGAHAPILRLIATAKSPQEAIERVEAHCAKMPVGRQAEIIESVMAAMAANGASAYAR